MMQIYHHNWYKQNFTPIYLVIKHCLTLTRFRVHLDRVVMKKENWALGLSLVAIVISIIAVCFAAYRSPDLNFDYQGVLVGILSLLVTMLIGWQIYSMIDAKNTVIGMKGDISNIATASDQQAARLGSMVHNSFAEFYRDKDDYVYEYFYNSLLTLKFSMMLEDIGACNAIVRVLNEHFPVNKPIRNFQKAMLLSVMNSINKTGPIVNIETLRDNIILFPSSDF